MKSAVSILLFTSLAYMLYAQTDNNRLHINYMTDPSHYKETGKGALVSESRPLTHEIREVVVGNGIQVSFTTTPAAFFEVRAQANLIPLVQSEIVGTKLVVQLKASLETDQGIFLNIPFGGIRDIHIKQGAFVDLRTDAYPQKLRLVLESGSAGFFSGKMDELSCIVMGGSELVLEGEATSADIAVKGGSMLKGQSFNSTNCMVTVLGASDCTIGVQTNLKARVENESTLLYYGNPKILDKETKLNGKIRKKNVR